jgi:hypothetical protein
MLHRSQFIVITLVPSVCLRKDQAYSHKIPFSERASHYSGFSGPVHSNHRTNCSIFTKTLAKTPFEYLQYKLGVISPHT